MKKAWLIYREDPDDGEIDVTFSPTEPDRWTSGRIVEIAYAVLEEID